ncbi:MAG: flagellar hook-basal body complex protein FliE [Angelakisella sp.]
MFIVPISQMPPIGASVDKPAQAPATSGVPFADILSGAIKNARETQAVTQEDAYKLAMGDMDDLHTMMINSSKATAAMEFTVELTGRAVNAYNEILRMQI